jgi:hypothetical protein
MYVRRRLQMSAPEGKADSHKREVRHCLFFDMLGRSDGVCFWRSNRHSAHPALLAGDPISTSVSCQKSDAIQFLGKLHFQRGNDITQLPRQIGIVTSRLATGCEQYDQVAFIRALAKFVNHDLQMHHALELSAFVAVSANMAVMEVPSQHPMLRKTRRAIVPKDNYPTSAGFPAMDRKWRDRLSWSKLRRPDRA